MLQTYLELYDIVLTGDKGLEFPCATIQAVLQHHLCSLLVKICCTIVICILKHCLYVCSLVCGYLGTWLGYKVMSLFYC